MKVWRRSCWRLREADDNLEQDERLLDGLVLHFQALGRRDQQLHELKPDILFWYVLQRSEFVLLAKVIGKDALLSNLQSVQDRFAERPHLIRKLLVVHHFLYMLQSFTWMQADDTIIYCDVFGTIAHLLLSSESFIYF